MSTGFRWRQRIVAMTLVLLVVLLTGRLLALQVIDTERGHAFLQSQGELRAVRRLAIPAHRGMITDRHDHPLAISTPVQSLWAEPARLNEVEAPRLRSLAQALNEDPERLGGRLHRARGRDFLYLHRQLPPEQAEQVLALGVPGVHARDEYRRFYPASEVGAHLVGFTDIDGIGLEGIELLYNQWLSGQSGIREVLRDRRGVVIRDLSLIQTMRPGRNLALSVDLRLQYLAHRALRQAVIRHGAASGMAVLLDAHSGEVLALVNQPSYNPNNRGSTPGPHFRNRSLTDTFEPGSTIKPLTMAVALASGRFEPVTELDTDPGHLEVEGKIIMDMRNHGNLDLTRILARSSQVGISLIALQLPEALLREGFAQFGLGQFTGTEFPGERPGRNPPGRKWTDLEKVTLAFGHGMTVNALQLARAYAVLAAGGVRRPVSLVRQFQPPAGQQVLDAGIASEVVAMMREATASGGTGTRARVPGYGIAGKTGTVHKVGGAGYEEARYTGIFAGIAPASAPRLVAVVVIDDPRGSEYFGGEVAAPVFAQLMGGALRLLDIPPDEVSLQVGRRL